MKDENSQTCMSKATAVCEEFCRYVVVDKKNMSILVNVKSEYYHELVRRLELLSYVELFSASLNPRHTVTATFVNAA